jgi:Flp pilus assembly protein protease CpaA
MVLGQHLHWYKLPEGKCHGSKTISLTRPREVPLEMPNVPSITRQFVLTMLLAGAMFYDLRYRIVPNFLIALAGGVGVVLAAMEGIDVCLKTILLALLTCYPFYYGYEKGWMGGGDVKLVAAISLLVGEELAGTYFLAGTMGGGFMSLVCLLLSRTEHSVDDGEGGGKPVVVPYAAIYAASGLLIQILLFAGGW